MKNLLTTLFVLTALNCFSQVEVQIKFDNYVEVGYVDCYHIQEVFRGTGIFDPVIIDSPATFIIHTHDRRCYLRVEASGSGYVEYVFSGRDATIKKKKGEWIVVEDAPFNPKSILPRTPIEPGQ